MTRFWSPAEDEMLASLCGDLPWPKVVTTYNRWATQHDMSNRTDKAMKGRCELLGLPRLATGAFVTSVLVFELLNVNRQTVLRWIKDGWLRTTQYGKGSPHYIRRKDLRRLARERPHLFGGQAESTLIQLLDNETLARQITAMELPAPLRLRPVVCIETGKRYASVGQAARAMYIDRGNLRKVVDHPDRTAAGYHWRSA